MSVSILDHRSSARPADRDAHRAHLLTRLRDELSDGEVFTGDDDLDRVATDRSGHRLPGRPLALVRPWTTAGVAATLRLASATGTVVVPRGAGTGLSGGASAPDGSLVLSTERLNRILQIDPADQVAVVQAGVVTADLDAAAAEHGLTYAPDPASWRQSTIGGNIATNAGGLHCVKYGVTRESVLALTAVLADGTVLPVGHRTIKGVAGFDLTGLFVGSEGTLGVVVEATVRLRPRPARTRTLAAWFPSAAAAAAGVLVALAQGVTPSVLELLDAGTLRAIDEGQGTDLAEYGSALLLVQTDGLGADAEIAALAGALVDLGADVDLPEGAEADRYFELRRSGRVLDERLWFVGEDVAVPRSAMGPLLERIERIGAAHGVSTSVVAHAGDGNLHPAFTLPRVTGESEPPLALERAADDLVRAALALGGTITGEHGVGITKRRWLEQELGAPVVDLQRRLKSVFDPAGVLNPHTWLAKEPSWPAS
ncbi:FAD-binding protein [Nakamurella flava]|uniref:FAD-binding protein n=1 Tax=Nakamurella flava TaxID=2576308 RepID=A0A4U6QL30_9ACTN|nr:FAD-linked oxidase C-terminal domain-containing protein [Nakamurella flava]TKV60842.1 FAD-binding protein [Nakamurella flava]